MAKTLTLDQKIDKVIEMFKDISLLCNLYRSDDFIEFCHELELIGDALEYVNDDNKEIAQREFVYYLSSFADRYGKVLYHISKKFPELYLEIDHPQSKEEYDSGEYPLDDDEN